MAEDNQGMDASALTQDRRKPTETTDDYWLQARNKSTRNNQMPGANCGKWLIFLSPEKIDEGWETIRTETENGELGCGSKVSTMMKTDVGKQNRDFVICVYTYDSTDEADVMRVRERLRELGFSRKLPYKTDAATYAGQYTTTSTGRVSSYYC